MASSAVTLRPDGLCPRRVCHSAPVTPPRTPIQLIRSSKLASPVPYVYAAVAHDVSRLIFTAGTCPLDDEGVIVAVGDVAAQTERVMTNLRIALQATEADLTDVIKTTVYVASHRRADLQAAWSVVRRTLMRVSGLAIRQTRARPLAGEHCQVTGSSVTRVPRSARRCWSEVCQLAVGRPTTSFQVAKRDVIS